MLLRTDRELNSCHVFYNEAKGAVTDNLPKWTGEKGLSQLVAASGNSPGDRENSGKREKRDKAAGTTSGTQQMGHNPTEPDTTNGWGITQGQSIGTDEEHNQAEENRPGFFKRALKKLSRKSSD